MSDGGFMQLMEDREELFDEGLLFEEGDFVLV